MTGDASSRELYPLSLDLADRLVLVVGGGPVAVRKARACLDVGARVLLVTPELADETLADDARVGWARSAWSREVVDGLTERVWLAHTATGDDGADEDVARWADAYGVWCVRADDAARSRAWNPAVVRGEGAAEGITVAVTGGADPRRSTRLRDAIGARLASGDLPVRRTRGTKGESPAVGHVALVGGGPGAPDLITVRGRHLLAEADVVVTDRLGPTELLDTLGPGVEVVDVGKHRDRHPVPQDQINAIIVEHARRGRRVVRLKGGDPFVLGRGGEEALHCAEHGIPVEVVPGITSAVAVPAAAGIPVTHRGLTTSFVVASGHDGAGPALDGLRDAPQDATLVLLMGVTALARTAERIVAAGRSPETPVAIVERGWMTGQRVTRTTLADAADDAERVGVQAPAVIVVGEVVTVPEQVERLLADSTG